MVLLLQEWMLSQTSSLFFQLSDKVGAAVGSLGVALTVVEMVGDMGVADIVVRRLVSVVLAVEISVGKTEATMAMAKTAAKGAMAVVVKTAAIVVGTVEAMVAVMEDLVRLDIYPGRNCIYLTDMTVYSILHIDSCRLPRI